MKKIIGIVFLLVLACFIILPFTSLTMARPVKLNVTTEDTEIPIWHGLYCADSFFTNQCKPGDLDDDSRSKVVDVSPGSTIKFKFDKKPDDLQIIWEDNDGNEEDRMTYREGDKNEIIVPEKSGVHKYSIEAKWNDKNRSAFNYFTIKVK